MTNLYWHKHSKFVENIHLHPSTKSLVFHHSNRCSPHSWLMAQKVARRRHGTHSTMPMPCRWWCLDGEKKGQKIRPNTMNSGVINCFPLSPSLLAPFLITHVAAEDERGFKLNPMYTSLIAKIQSGSVTLYRARLKGGLQVSWMLFLLLLTNSAWTCSQHSHNLPEAF